jgi:hypothetical protein
MTYARNTAGNECAWISTKRHANVETSAISPTFGHERGGNWRGQRGKLPKHDWELSVHGRASWAENIDRQAVFGKSEGFCLGGR